MTLKHSATKVCSEGKRIDVFFIEMFLFYFTKYSFVCQNSKEIKKHSTLCHLHRIFLCYIRKGKIILPTLNLDPYFWNIFFYFYLVYTIVSLRANYIYFCCLRINNYENDLPITEYDLLGVENLHPNSIRNYFFHFNSVEINEVIIDMSTINVTRGGNIRIECYFVS